MKQKLLLGIAALAIAVVAVWNVNFSSKDDGMLSDDVMLANVEALAQETGGSSDEWDCWSNLKEGYGVWVCGSPCFFKDDRGQDSGKLKCYSN